MERVEIEQGFFRNYYNKIKSSLNDDQLREFGDLKNNEERFVFVSKLNSIKELNLKHSTSGKDYENAILLKNQGNKAFQEENYKKAWKLYSESALKIPWKTGDNSELAIIVANRAAALYHMQEYDLAIADIEFSYKLGYPPELHFKVADRKARCLLAKKQLKDALIAFRETLTALDNAKLNRERKQKWQLDVQIMLSMLQKNAHLANAPLDKPVTPQPELARANSSYKSASAAIKIDQSPSMGRFAVASQNIKVGEPLVLEPAYCSVLLEEHSKTHCFHCFSRLKNPVPCKQCSAISFCSQVCQESALNTHHKYECGILKTLWSSGASITCLMALRILSQSSVDYFVSLRPQLGESPKIHRTGDYLDVFGLVTHEGSRTADDLFHRANMAVFLFECLRISGYFGSHVSKEGEDLTPNEIFIGSLILHHLQLLQFNAHEISELVLEEDGDVESAKSIFLGGGLYPTLALFNHSCDPGVIRYFSKTSVVVRAAKNIECGEMIAENYGPIFTQTPKVERQKTLKTQYWFDCSCVPCEQNWPRFDEMNPNILRFKCSSDSNQKCKNVIEVSSNSMEFMVKCSECDQITNILKGLKALQDTEVLFKTAKNLMEKRDMANALNTFMELLNRLDETLAPPFHDYHLCQQGIKRCMLYLGNKYQLR